MVLMKMYTLTNDSESEQSTEKEDVILFLDQVT